MKQGGLVAFPTETVYGLGADATNERAIAKLYSIKGRPSFNPLIAHVPSLEAAQAQARFNQAALKLAAAFWPGPLTMVLPVKKGCTVSLLARSGLETLAIRVPSHPVALKLLEHIHPLCAPSANLSGHVSPTSAAHVRDDFGSDQMIIIDTGPCSAGIESTIVACLGSDVRILRPGPITTENIEQALGKSLTKQSLENKQEVQDVQKKQELMLAPGQLKSHYAPRTPIRLNAVNKRQNEVFLDFGSSNPEADVDLSAKGDLQEAASRLFWALRLLDKKKAAFIAIAPIPQHGLGVAINERLARAAA